MTELGALFGDITGMKNVIGNPSVHGPPVSSKGDWMIQSSPRYNSAEGTILLRGCLQISGSTPIKH